MKATQIDPNLADPHVRLAELYMVGGKYDEAMAHALETLKLDPNNVRAMMTTGTVYQQRGDVSEGARRVSESAQDQSARRRRREQFGRFVVGAGK